MKKIVILDGYTSNPGDLSWESLEALGDLTVYDRSPNDDNAELIRRVGDAEILLTIKTLVGREVIDACPRLAYIGVLATGYNVVDLEAAKLRGIPVTNIPAYSTDSVAQMVFAHLLAICLRVSEHSASVFRGDWTKSDDFAYWNYPLIELAGKTMGFLGFGQIGQRTAKIARAFGMETLAHSRTQREEGKQLATYVSLEELLSRSDVISLHAPLTPETQGIINRDIIAKMKDGAILINTSRGPLVVDEDLREALESGKLYHAGVDVASAEPIRGDNPLLQAPNLYITPHIAWAPRESRVRLIRIATDNVKAFLDGAPVNVVC